MGYSTRIILISCIIRSYLSMCPEDIVGNDKCRDSPGTKYHCQYHPDTDTTTDTCAPEVNCSAGTYAAINSIEKRVTCMPCSPEMFQSHAKLSTAFTQPNCDERITPCGKGELQCGAASPSQNYKCRCDNSLGWRPNPLKGCDCFLKDAPLCVCQETPCGPGEVLASNFTCVPVSTTVGTFPPCVSGINPKPVITSKPGSTVAPIILGVLLGIAMLVIIALVILLVAEAPSAEKRGKQLYNKIKTVFIESVDPKPLLLRIDFGSYNDERLRGNIDRHGREDGAAELLQTVERQFPTDWFEMLTKALRHPDIGLSHTADEMDEIRDKLSKETVELQSSGEQVPASESRPLEKEPLVPTAPPGQETSAV
ncbi:uncharacterized protein LOC124149861 isoform X2 [Haliotis rufescens]|uniref:uncharacterized protein LOC124149861 isoform X2 n=1 Tax=Haliotis rufescens TaxID=6454 RepID=UPI00201EECA5|nr:uncharacterized protein LOC124149861 isoform X2 [Haliotis rufescens]